MQYITHSEEETARLAHALAAQTRPGALYCLYGDLGAGKSVFARGFIRALCGEDTDVPSPTFTLLQTYDSPRGPLYHFDLYRIEDPQEIYELGWEDALAEGITLVEWPQRLGPLLPPDRTDVRLIPLDGPRRKIEIDEQTG